MTMLSDPHGNVRFLLHPPEIAILTPKDTYFHVVINESSQYGVEYEGLKQICFDTSEPRQIIPSPHEQKFKELFGELGIDKGIFVDIGAYDGVNYSHTRALAEKGWQGMMLECEPFRFATLADLYRRYTDISLIRSKVTPHNVLSLLQSGNIPYQFDFLSLDIDSYDYFVLEKILSQYRPTVICTEINEVIPPPVRFAVNYSPDFVFDLSQRFYGMSLAALADLAERHGYILVDMYYMDIFLIDANCIDGKTEDLETFYRQKFLEQPRPGYYHNYPFDVEAVLNASPEHALALIQSSFDQFKGQYSSGLSPFLGTF
jgi:hypothetical protein